MNKKRVFGLSFVVVLYGLFFYFTDGTCFIRSIIGYPCPTCGTTRALLALGKGDFKSYLYYNPLGILILIMLLVGIFYPNKIEKKKKLYLDLFLIVSSVAVFSFYLYRLIYRVIP